MSYDDQAPADGSTATTVRRKSWKRAGRSSASQPAGGLRRRLSTIGAMPRRSSAIEATLMNLVDGAEPAGLTICKQIRHLPFRETIGIPAVSQVGAPLAAILQSARTMQQIMNANVLERRLRINLKCLHQHTAIAALAHGT